MRILLLQLDGKLPNLALMRLAAHHRDLGDEVELRHAGNHQTIQRRLSDASLRWDKVYGSLIFERTRQLGEAAKRVHPDIVLGGTGWDIGLSLESIGVTTKRYDYADYPHFKQSLGFTQRGCRLKCSFCVVPRSEGAVREEATIADIWRGDPYPREVLLLDNDFFGQPNWSARIEELRAGDFKVSFNQGINARMLTDEAAAAIASVNYRDDSMKVKRIYTAWDSKHDEGRLFKGLNALVKYGVKPDHIMVYILIGFDPKETHEDRDYRRRLLREFGARPYPMPFVRNDETVGFQRWVIGAYDKRVTWEEWRRASHEPRKIPDKDQMSLPLQDGEP